MDILLPILGLILLGAGVGVISAALGVGGGILMVPAFSTFIPGMDMNTAKGSSLFVIVFVAAYNSWRMNRGTMKSPWEVIALIAAGSISGGYLGASVTARMSDVAVTWIFVGLLGLAAVRMFFLKTPVVPEDAVRRRRVLSVLVGLSAGFVAGATGTGGGAILVPLALWSGICSNDRVVALSNTVMVATAASSTFGHYRTESTVDLAWTYGQVNVALAPFVILGAVGAAPLGRKLNAALTLQRRRLVMAALLLVIAVRLIYRALT